MKQIIYWLAIVLATFGIGAGIGLGISWGISPIKSQNSTPATLNPSGKDTYRILIADNFRVTGDLARARIRLDLLDGSQATNELVEQAYRLSMDPVGEKDSNSLIFLHDAIINIHSPATSSVTLLTNTIQAIPSDSTVTPDNANYFPVTTKIPITATETLSVTPSTFTVINSDPICDPNQQTPLLQVMVIDPSGKPKSGIVIQITFPGGSERIITGLQPELGKGYADFRLTPGVNYALNVQESVGTYEKISATDCFSMTRGTYPGGWLLVIQL